MSLNRRSKRWGYLLASLLLLLVLVHLPPAKKLLRPIISGGIASVIGGRFELGALDYALWEGKLELRDFYAAPDERLFPLTLAARRAELRISPFNGITLRFDRPELNLLQLEGATVRVKRSALERLIPFQLRLLEVSEGTVRILDAADHPWLEIASIDLKFHWAGSYYEAQIHSPKARIESDAGEIPFGPLEARLEIRGSELEIRSSRVEKGASLIEATGTVSSLKPFVAKLDLTFRTESELVRSIRPEIELRGVVEGQAHLDSGPDGLRVASEFHSSDLAWNRFGPWVTTGEASFADGSLELQRLNLTGYGGTVEAEGRFDLTRGQQSIQLEFAGLDLARAGADLLDRDLPLAARARGQISLSLAQWSLESAEGGGRVALVPGSEGQGIPVEGEVLLSFQKGTARFDSDKLSIPGGEMGFSARLEPSGRLDATYRIQMDELRVVKDLFEERAPNLDLSGPITMQGEASGPLSDISWSGTVASRSLRLQGKPFELEAELGLARNRFQVKALSFREARPGGGFLEASGIYQLDTQQLKANIQARGLPLASMPLMSGKLAGLDGAISSLDAHLEGPWLAPLGEVRLQLDELSFRGLALPALSVEIHSDGKSAELEAHWEDGRRLVLARGELESPYPMEATFDLSALPLDALLQSDLLLADEEARLEARGRLDVSVSALHPSELQYRAHVEELVGIYLGIGGGTGSPFLIEGDLRSFRVEDLDFVGTGTAIAVAGRVSLTADEGFDLRLKGAARLELLEPAFAGVGLAGQASVDLHLLGSLDELELFGDVTLEGAQGTFHGSRLSEITGRIEGDAHRIFLQSLTGKLLGGTFRLQGELPLPSAQTPEPHRLQFEITQFDLAELLPEREDYAADPILRFSASGFLETPRLSGSAIRGSGTISGIRAGLGELEIGNDEPATWSMEAGRLALPRLRLEGGQTDLRARAAVRLTEEGFAWEASLQGSLDNALVNPLLGAAGDIVISGTTEVDLNVRSAPEGPRFDGNGSFEGAQVVIREPPLVFSNIRGKMRFEDQEIALSGITADVGGGKVEGSGTIALAGLDALGPMDLELSADSVRLLYPEGMRSEQSGSFRFSGGPDRFLLSGDLRLLQSLFSRDLTLETELLSSLPRETVRLSGEDSFAEKVRLDVRAQTVEDLQIDNNLAKLQAGGNVLVSGTLASPEIDGVFTARSEGTFQLGRNQYLIQSGRIVLRGYPSEPPELDLDTRTTVSGVDIVMQIRGTPDNLSTELRAPDRPELSRADLASLLVTGRTLADTPDLERLSGQEREVLTEQLVSYLGGTFAGLAEKGLSQVLPFNRVSVDPARIASEVDPEVRFTLGMGITEQLLVTYSVGLNNSQSQLWVVDYSLPKRLRLRASQLEDDLTGSVSQRLFLDFHRAAESSRPDPRLRIASVHIEGGLPGFEQKMKKEVHMKAGDHFDYWKAQGDARRLRHLVRGQGYLGVMVDVETKLAEEGQVDLLYRVNPGKPVELLWKGDDPGTKIRTEIEDAWDGRLPKSFLVSELASKAVIELQRDRYYRARINTSVEEAPGGVLKVTFSVSRGVRSQGLVIDFDGNEALSDQELRAALPSAPSAELYDLLFENPDRLRKTLETFYASRGYLSARIGQPEEAGEPAGDQFRVVIQVDEGARSEVAEIDLEGASSITVAKLRTELSLRKGQPFRLADYERDRTTLTSVYRREGFADVRVRGSLERSEEGLRVVFKIEEGARVVVGDIRIVGNQATRESLIRRQITFEKGDPLRLSDLTETQRRLYDLGIFRSADVRVEPAADSTQRNVLVEVTEAADLNINYGLRFNSDERFEILTELRVPNLFGGGQHAGLIVEANTKESLIRGTFHTPYLFSRYNLDTDVFVTRETEDSEFFTDRAWSFTFQQTRHLKERLDLQWSYSFRRFRTVGKVDIGPFPFDFSVDRALLTGSVIEDRRDNPIRPSRGRFWNITFQAAPEELGSDITFVKLFGQIFAFLPLGHDVVWASSYRLGVADAFGQLLLPVDRFKAGGSDSVRGFAQDSLGPVDPFTESAIGGEGVAVFNQELRFPLYRWFRSAVFFDAGNVYLTASDFDPLDLRYSAGVGIRFNFPFGLLRLDWARAFDRRPGEEASQLWFSFGHAF